jgi:hypothetical protein
MVAAGRPAVALDELCRNTYAAAHGRIQRGDVVADAYLSREYGIGLGRVSA